MDLKENVFYQLIAKCQMIGSLPRRIKAGINPLKSPLGPTLIISLKQSSSELYVPGGAFINRVFITSNGMVNKVAPAPKQIRSISPLKFS